MYRRVIRKKKEPGSTDVAAPEWLPDPPVAVKETGATLGAFHAGLGSPSSDLVGERSARERDQGQFRQGRADAVRVAALGLQAKLSIGGTDDPAEREADDVAAEVVSRIRRNESGVEAVGVDFPPAERVQRRVVARSMTGTVRRDGDETVGPESATAPDFSQPITAGQVQAFPLQAAQQMKNNDNICKNIHKTAFASSWVRAKHALIGDPETEKVMEQLLVFRQRSHDRVFAKTMVEIETTQDEEGGLTSASAAGSQTLSSDIDANLKGRSTEDAVATFNRIFSDVEGWDMESGVVFDINVYALDFMHGTTDAGGQGLQAVGEGVREGATAGGVASSMNADADVVGADLMEQRSWALVKVRQYTTLSEWQGQLDASGTPRDLSTMAQARHLAYYREVTNKMAALSGVDIDSLGADTRLLVNEPSEILTPQASLEKIAAALVAGQVDADVKEEQLMLSSANRIYEQKLTEVAQIRKDLEGALEGHEIAGRGLVGTEIADAERNVEIHLTLLRDKISEGNLFANEAYLTDGAVNHAVQGLQIGNAIRQNAAQGGDAITENMADALKEIHRHGKNGSLGEAAFKCGKYLFRLADAARNAGISDVLVIKMYTLGDEISNRIKKTDYSKPGVPQPEGEGDPHECASAAAVGDQFGMDVTTPELLAKKVQEVGALAMSKISAMDSASLGSPVSKPGK